MTALLAIICIVLIAIIVVQIGRVTELASKIRGEEDIQDMVNKRQGLLMLIFMIVFLVGTVISSIYYKNWFLGYGPHESASSHGISLDYMFDITLVFTGIVFVITQILLFWYAYKYAGQRGQKALFMPHNNKVEIIWTVIPAVVMTFLVVGGLDTWNEVMADVNEDEDYLEIEATGYQFAWQIRYPGPDGKLGTRDYRQITGINPLGQVWEDAKNLDDILPDEIVLPVGKKVRVRITARDVLHNFYLPHFRVKMDAVPGMPTYFVFTPTKTTEEYRVELSKYDEYQFPMDATDPESPLYWEAFEYELACAELCGNGHFSMRRLVKIVSEDEYNAWLNSQNSYYMTSIRGSEQDPNIDIWLDSEIRERKVEFNDAVEKALSSGEPTDKTLLFKYVNFKEGSAELTALSKYEIGYLVEILNRYPAMQIELAGHTDNTGNTDSNQILSEDRASSVYNELTSKGIDATRLSASGYGETQPVDTNDTEAGRAKNRRTEFKIISQ